MATKKTKKSASKSKSIKLNAAKKAASKVGVKGLSGKSLVSDYSRSAKAPGKRKSATGKTYYESRINRSDEKGSKI